jgi:hypothetical protein
MLWVDSTLKISMEAGARPIRYLLNPTMLHRIPMNIIDMTMKIGFVSNPVFPKSALP